MLSLTLVEIIVLLMYVVPQILLISYSSCLFSSLCSVDLGTEVKLIESRTGLILEVIYGRTHRKVFECMSQFNSLLLHEEERVCVMAQVN